MWSDATFGLLSFCADCIRGLSFSSGPVKTFLEAVGSVTFSDECRNFSVFDATDGLLRCLVDL